MGPSTAPCARHADLPQQAPTPRSCWVQPGAWEHPLWGAPSPTAGPKYDPMGGMAPSPHDAGSSEGAEPACGTSFVPFKAFFHVFLFNLN